MPPNLCGSAVTEGQLNNSFLTLSKSLVIDIIMSDYVYKHAGLQIILILSPDIASHKGNIICVGLVVKLFTNCSNLDLLA
jgi:hypothetical protein